MDGILTAPQSNIHAFNYFEGTPEILVPDNLKSGVNQACKYEPSINQSYREMAKHYNCVVIPARAYRPKDKAKVENGVLLVGRWILAALRNRTFFSLEELNEAIGELLEELNKRPFQKMKSCRHSLFEEVDKTALRPLPATPYIIAEWKKARVNIDYHIQLEGCFYSVPYRLRGQEVNVRYTLTTVEIFHKEVRVASHARKHRPNECSTTPEHMPHSHRQHLEWSPSRMLHWGGSIGPHTEAVFKKLMETKEHPELAYKACLGIIGLGKRYGNERLEKSCQRALKLNVVSYRSLKSILEKNLDKIPLQEEQQELPLDHENIRGERYYQ